MMRSTNNVRVGGLARPTDSFGGGTVFGPAVFSDKTVNNVIDMMKPGEHVLVLEVCDIEDVSITYPWMKVLCSVGVGYVIMTLFEGV